MKGFQIFLCLLISFYAQALYAFKIEVSKAERLLKQSNANMYCPACFRCQPVEGSGKS